MITLAGMFQGMRLIGQGHAAGNLTPYLCVRTIIREALRFGRTRARHQPIQPYQFFELFTTGRTGAKMRMHIGRVQYGIRGPTRFLKKLRQFYKSNMLGGITVQD